MLNKNLTKLIILLIVFCIGISSCSPTQWNSNSNCNMSEKQIIDNAVRILLEEGYNIGSQDNNFVSASLTQTYIPVILNYKVRWDISAQNNKIIANAYVNFWGLIHLIPGEDLNESYKSYWRVRRKLEKVCGSKMLITNTISNDDEFKK